MILQNKLYIVYTIICMILLNIFLSILCPNKKKYYCLKILRQKSIIKALFVIIFFIIIILICILGLFFSFVIFNGMASLFIDKQQFFELQLFTNIPNFYILGMIIKVIREK